MDVDSPLSASSGSLSGSSTATATAPSPLGRRRLRAVLLRLLPNVLGLLLLGWFLRGLNMRGFLTELRALRPAAVLGIAVSGFIETSVQGLLFYCLCPAGQSAWRHVWLSFAINAGNIFLPLRSGEIIRPFYLKRWQPQLGYKALIGWTLVDKWLQMVSVLPFLLIGLYLFAADPQLSSALRRIGVAVVGLLVVVSVALGVWVRRRLRDNLGEQAAGLPLRGWLGATFWALCMWGAAFLVYYFTVLDSHVGLALMIGVGFGSGMPSLPASVGAYEASFLWVGERSHLPHDQVLTAAVVSHVVQLLTTLSFGIPVLLIWGWPKAQEKAAPAG